MQFPLCVFKYCTWCIFTQTVQVVQVTSKSFLSSTFSLEPLILPQVQSSAVKMDDASRTYPTYHKWTFPFSFPCSTYPKGKRLFNVLLSESLRSLKSIMKTESRQSAWLLVHNTPKFLISLYTAHHIHYKINFQQKWSSLLL